MMDDIEYEYFTQQMALPANDLLWELNELRVIKEVFFERLLPYVHQLVEMSKGQNYIAREPLSILNRVIVRLDVLSEHSPDREKALKMREELQYHFYSILGGKGLDERPWPPPKRDPLRDMRK